MKPKFSALSFAAFGGLLVASTNMLSREVPGDHIKVGLMTILACIAAGGFGFYMDTVMRDGRRRNRQIREIDLRAHELKVSADDMQTTVETRHDADELGPILKKKLGRNDKIAVLLDELGFEITMKLVRDTARIKNSTT